MAHLALTDISRKNFRYLEKASRANLGLAGAAEDRYRIWAEDWKIEEDGPNHVLLAGDKDWGLSLKAVPVRAPAIHGLQGVSQKGEGPGHASHYYSLTRMETSGMITLQAKQIPVTGLSWMDHEFGSNQLLAYQVGWDWFSLQLENGWDLMLYQIRRQDGRVDPYSSGTLVVEDGRAIHLPLPQWQIAVLGFWKSPKSKAEYPAAWQINVPAQGLALRLKPLVQDQELLTLKSTRVTYWEGAVSIEGVLRGRPIRGRGYVEMTGYDKRFVPRI
jgi:predicted secreted hydrolase